MYGAAFISLSSFSDPFLFCFFIFSPINKTGIAKKICAVGGFVIIKFKQVKMNCITKFRVFDHQCLFSISHYFILGFSGSKLNFFNIFYLTTVGCYGLTDNIFFKNIQVMLS